MNVNFERSKAATDEWYTPKEIIDALGSFDLDPCAPVSRLWDTAIKHYTKEDDGLTKEWFGRVWLNPPYSRPLIEQFVKKLVDHNNGIALLYNRADTDLFQNTIFPNATAMLMVKGRIKFYKPDGTVGASPGSGSILFAFGRKNARILKNSGIEGRYIKLK